MMSSTHDREPGAGAGATATAGQVRDGENNTGLTAKLRSKSLEVARNGFAGATAGGERRNRDEQPLLFLSTGGGEFRFECSCW